MKLEKVYGMILKERLKEPKAGKTSVFLDRLGDKTAAIMAHVAFLLPECLLDLNEFAKADMAERLFREAELKNDKGETLQIEGESAEFMNRLITAVEITDCYKEKSCYTCEEWDGHFKKCDHPDKPQSSADYCDRDNCCDLWVAKG